MSTYQTQIEDLIGSVGDTAFLTDVLTNGAKELFSIIPHMVMDEFAIPYTDAGSGIAVASLKVLSAHKAGYPARKVPAEMKARYTLAGSIHLATATDPIFYAENKKIYVLPGGGTVNAVKYPTIAFGDSPGSYSSGDAVPTEVESLLVLKGAIEGRMRQLVDKRTSLPANLNLEVAPAVPSITESIATSLSTIAYSQPSAPTAPSVPVFSNSDVTATGVASTSITSFGTAPTYIPPSLTLTTAPVISDLDLSTISLPTIPSDPVYTYVDATAATIAGGTVGAFGTAPVFVPPVLVLTTAPTISDLDLTSVSVPSVPTAPVFTFSDASLSSVFAATTVTLPSTVPIYITPTMDLDHAQVDTYIQNEEDTELAQAQIEANASRIQEYQLKQEDAQSDFNEDATIYGAQVQKAIDDANSIHDNLMAKAKAETDLNLQNEIQTAAQQAKEYSSTLQRFQAEVGKYSADISTRAQEYTINELQHEFAEWQTKRGNDIQAHGMAIQEAKATFEAANVVYQGTIQSAVRNADIAEKKLSEYAKSVTDVSKQNKLQQLSAQVQEYSANLQKFQNQMALYNANVSMEVQEYTINEIQHEFAQWQTQRSNELAKQAQDIGIAKESLNKENIAFQSVIQKNITTAQMTQQRLIEVAKQADDLATKNKARALQAIVQEYTNRLELYQRNLTKYQLQQTDEVNVMQVAVAKRASEMQEVATLNKDKISKYSAQLQGFSIENQSKIQDYSARNARWAGEHTQMSNELQMLQGRYKQGLQALIGKEQQDGQ